MLSWSIKFNLQNSASFFVLVGILTIYFPCLNMELLYFHVRTIVPWFKTWKTVLFILMFLSDLLLIKTPLLLILDTFVCPHPTIWIPPPKHTHTHIHLFGTVRSTFFKIVVFLVITGYGKEKRNVRFLIWCTGVAVCGRLLVVSVRLLVVCSRLLVVCGSCLFFPWF